MKESVFNFEEIVKIVYAFIENKNVGISKDQLRYFLKFGFSIKDIPSSLFEDIDNSNNAIVFIIISADSNQILDSAFIKKVHSLLIDAKENIILTNDSVFHYSETKFRTADVDEYIKFQLVEYQIELMIRWLENSQRLFALDHNVVDLSIQCFFQIIGISPFETKNIDVAFLVMLFIIFRYGNKSRIFESYPLEFFLKIRSRTFLNEDIFQTVDVSKLNLNLVSGQLQ